MGQEYRSIDQFRERMGELGWLTNTKERDLGEDLVVDIYDEGMPAGISFVAQLKSTTNLDELVLARAPSTITYRLYVADVEHWEVSAALVVVVLWDVTRKTGVWITVPELLKQLDTADGWRSQETVTVHFSRSNGTSASDLQRLRRLVADRNLPILRRGKDIEIKGGFSFPATEEGRAAAHRLAQMIDCGEPVEIEGKFIERWDMSSWWERLYGRSKPESVAIACKEGRSDIPVRLEVDLPTGVYSRELNLRRIRAGKKGLALSNDHEGAWLKASVVARQDGDKVDLTTKLRSRLLVEYIFQARDAAEFALAMRQANRFRLVIRDSGLRICEDDVPPDFGEWSTPMLRDWTAFLDKLHVVQTKIHRHGVVKIPRKGVSRKAAQAVEFFYAVCTTREVLASSGEARLEFRLDPLLWKRIGDAVKRGEPLAVDVRTANAGSIRILNVKVPLGPVQIRFDFSVFHEQIEAAMKKGKQMVTIKGVGPSRRCYPDWAPVTTRPDTNTKSKI